MGEERQSGATPNEPRARDAVADRMLDVAVAQIEAEGLRVGVDQIRMEQVIEAAGVSRASAYRRWPSREAFLADVLVATVRRTSLLPETEEDLSRLVALVRSVGADVLGTEQGRRDLVVEGLRLASDADIRRTLSSSRWRTHLALTATHAGLPAGRVQDAVGQALLEADGVMTARRAAVYANLCDLIGYRLVPPASGEEGFRRLAATTGLMMAGIVLRTIPSAGWLDDRQEAVLFGASRPAPWSQAERSLVGVLLAHLEPDPDQAWDGATIEARLATFFEQVDDLLAP